jgi:ActR/RegA family two-component response regulator
MKIVAAVTDLFFTVKINEAAKRAGLGVQFVKTKEDAVAAAAEKPKLLIVDLNCDAVEPLDMVRGLKAEGSEHRSVVIIGYLSHLQADLKKQAQEAGCNMVLARSAFSQNIVQILQRNAGIPVGAALPRAAGMHPSRGYQR